MIVNIIEYLFVWNNCAEEIELNSEYDMFLGVTKWKYFALLAVKMSIATLMRPNFFKTWNI